MNTILSKNIIFLWYSQLFLEKGIWHYKKNIKHKLSIIIKHILTFLSHYNIIVCYLILASKGILKVFSHQIGRLIPIFNIFRYLKRFFIYDR